MDFQDIPAMLKEVLALLIQAEHSPNPAERADAMTWLRAVHAKLQEELHEAENNMQPNLNRKVEVASLRAAITTLTSEMRMIEAIEQTRSGHQKQKSTG